MTNEEIIIFCKANTNYIENIHDIPNPKLLRTMYEEFQEFMMRVYESTEDNKNEQLN